MRGTRRRRRSDTRSRKRHTRVRSAFIAMVTLRFPGFDDIPAREGTRGTPALYRSRRTSSSAPLRGSSSRSGRAHRLRTPKPAVRGVVSLLELAHGPGLVGAVQLVDLRRDDRDRRLHCEQPRVPGLVLRQIRMSRIDELKNAADTPLLARRRIEVGLCELLECVDRLAAAARVAIARQVDQIQGWA